MFRTTGAFFSDASVEIRNGPLKGSAAGDYHSIREQAYPNKRVPDKSSVPPEHYYYFT